MSEPGFLLRRPLDDWFVELNDGAIAVVRASAYSEEGPDYVFVALMDNQPGTPPVWEYEVSRFPVASVRDVWGGRASGRPLAPPQG